MPKGFITCFLLSASIAVSQSLTGSGYTPPAPVPVAQGQIATFYVAGLSSITGLTANLQQGGNSLSAPVQSIRNVSQCPDDILNKIAACGSLFAVTVQIPYEMMPICPLCASPIIQSPPPVLTIAQNGKTLSAIEVTPFTDEVHILTACDEVLGPTTPPQPNLSGLPCAPVVTHADGTMVTASSPANPGEELTAWGFGLGQTAIPSSTGQKAVGGATVETFHLDFNYSVNALPTKPYIGSPDRLPPSALYSGLVAGYIGLYQINFVVPPGPPNGIARCSTPGSVAFGGAAVQSNLTVSIGGQFSFDGAGICVATQIPVD
jgi:uncharacterized protein (TIGR03437 family)